MGLAGVSRSFVDVPRSAALLERNPERSADYEAGEALDFKEAARYAIEWRRWGVERGVASAALSSPGALRRKGPSGSPTSHLSLARPTGDLASASGRDSEVEQPCRAIPACRHLDR